MKKTDNNDPTKAHPWRHPIHTRGVPSRTYSSPVGKPLTDAAIERYMLSGFYGPAAQRRAELAKRLREERAKERQVNKVVVKQLLEDLD